MSQPATARPLTAVRTTVTPTAATSDIIISQPQPVDLVVYQGDSGRFRVSVTDPNNLPLDVSGAVWNCQIRQMPDDTITMATLTVQPVSGDVSSVDCILTAQQSALLNNTLAYWDLEMILGGETQTLLSGKCNITLDVSRP